MGKILLNGVDYSAANSGASVTGVKGNAETSYRTGDVNLTPANIGLGNVPDVTTNDQTPTFTQASERSNIVSGEKLSILLGKIMKWFADLKTVAFSGSYDDLNDKPTIPAAVAVKGNAETSYRTGNVNLTSYDIGALPENGTAINSQKVCGYSIQVLTQEAFDALSSKDDSTLYFTYK